ncbi:MAG: DegT/DnrJ/EryC1/StrS family aminotransferase, partial [Acidobacteriia bacterium]|nr:DegT/DnrJ/EryC1/StrS family aminotransferase [Terriglobia bacterium]
GAGDEVITVPFTFVATVAAIRYTGARPVFVDVDPESLTMDTRLVEAAITPRTRAILPVHLYGQPADMEPLVEIARRHNLILIEDAAQAHFAQYKEAPVGSIGKIGCFSFYPGKNLGAYGEGGLAVTSDPEFARRMRMMRDWGQEQRYHHVLPGYNYRMDGIQGAILRVKLRRLADWTAARQQHAVRYNELLAGMPLRRPAAMTYGSHVYHLYVIRTGERAALQESLAAQGIQTGIHYPFPVHLLRAHADLGYHRGDFPVAETAANEVLSLPMYGELTDTQIAEVCGAIQAFANTTRTQAAAVA